MTRERIDSDTVRVTTTSDVSLESLEEMKANTVERKMKEIARINKRYDPHLSYLQGQIDDHKATV